MLNTFKTILVFNHVILQKHHLLELIKYVQKIVANHKIHHYHIYIIKDQIQMIKYAQNIQLVLYNHTHFNKKTNVLYYVLVIMQHN